MDALAASQHEIHASQMLKARLSQPFGLAAKRMIVRLQSPDPPPKAVEAPGDRAYDAPNCALAGQRVAPVPSLPNKENRKQPHFE